MDVLIPTVDRPAALAITLSGLATQTTPLRVIIADQSDDPVAERIEVATMLRVVRLNGHTVEVHRRPDRQGVAEQRAFLLGRARSPEVLCLDDDIWLQPWSIALMRGALHDLDAGWWAWPRSG